MHELHAIYFSLTWYTNKDTLMDFNGLLISSDPLYEIEEDPWTIPIYIGTLETFINQ